MPEMQVREDPFGGEKIIERSALQDFDGKFVVMKGTNGRNYVFAQIYEGGHEEIAFHFRAIAHGEYQCEEAFSPMNGGRLSVNKQKILFHGKSVDLGKYDEQIVRPIAEKWKRKL